MKKDWHKLFDLRGKLPRKTALTCEVIGLGCIFLTWYLITELKFVPEKILPSPVSILKSFVPLHYEDALVRNLALSFCNNFLGCVEAVILALPIGFAIGLFPIFRATFERYTTVIRFLPLTALVGLFMNWFGIGTNMKVQFLSFSIFIYLVPAIIQRVNEVEGVYVQTVETLGANKWQVFQSVYFPAVISTVYGDIITLAALSWTYIVVAEVIYANAGGVGSLIFIATRQSDTAKVFAVLIVIILVGYLQDILLKGVERFLFPYKYARKGAK